MGLPLVDLLHPAEPNSRAATAIREIGELRIREKNLQLYCRMSSSAFTRMAYSGEGQTVHVLKGLRRIAATAGAIVVGIINVAMHRHESTVELKPGDPAPDFSLLGSDGRTYRLKDLAGRPVVIAWFPKAFTGG
jgi:hypothetical protein